jgi:uncharacterized protein (UPF0216 family)
MGCEYTTPDISDRVLFKWLKLEIGKINETIVTDRKRLSLLLEEAAPVAVTKGGEEYRFDRETLQQLGERLPESLHRKLRVPILFYSDMTVRDSCFLDDEYALEALQELGELNALRRMQDGRVWIARAIVYSIMEKYPTIVQIVMR